MVNILKTKTFWFSTSAIILSFLVAQIIIKSYKNYNRELYPWIIMISIIVIGSLTTIGIILDFKDKKNLQNSTNKPFNAAEALKLWKFWVIITAVYLFLQAPLQLLKYSFIRYIAYFIGLFVPIGFASGIALILNPFVVMIEVTLTLLTLIYGEKLAIKWGLNHLQKFLFNILILFLLTLVIDLIVWGGWKSMTLLIKGYVGF